MATRTRGNIPARRTPPPSQLPETGTIQHPRPHHSSSEIITSFAQNQDSTNVSKKQSKRSTRRSIFDDPSSPSTTQNTRVSPNPTLGSSTFSSRTGATQKTGPARKPSSLHTRPLSSGKKRFIYVKKQDIGTSAAAIKEQLRSPPEKVEVSNAYDVPQTEQKPKHQESSINEAKEEVIQVGSSNENKTKGDVLVQEDPEPISNAQIKAENRKDVNLKTDKPDITPVVKTESAEAVSQVAETVSNINHEFSEAHHIDEISSGKTDENIADNPTSEVGEMNKQPAKTLVSDEKEEAGGTEIEVRESKETEAQEVGRETWNVAPKTQVSKGKKESVVSNDVIEETASRLREQRKNKVKALAGAFETVISLQEQK